MENLYWKKSIDYLDNSCDNEEDLRGWVKNLQKI